MVPSNVKRLLDVGCGDGSMSSWIKSKYGCELVGITYSEAEAEKARSIMNSVVLADLDHLDSSNLGLFDCVLCCHVIEHIKEPEKLLVGLMSNLSPDGVMIIAVPNVLFWKQRLKFLLGEFRYTDGGIMDRTHLRFFDWESAATMLQSAGFAVQSQYASGSVPGSRFLGSQLERLVNDYLLRKLPGVFGWQFIYRINKKSAA